MQLQVGAGVRVFRRPERYGLRVHPNATDRRKVIEQ